MVLAGLAGLALEVALEDDAQTAEGEGLVDQGAVAGAFGDEAGEAAGGDGVDARAGREAGVEMLEHAVEDAVDEADVAVVEADLDVVDGACADDLGGAFDVDAGEAGGAAEEGFGGDAEAGRDGSAEELAAGGDDVEGGGGAHVDDDAGAFEAVEGGDAVDDAVGADLGGVVGEDGQAGFDARLDEERADFEELLADGAKGGVDGRDDGGDGDAGDVVHGDAGDLKEAAEEHAELVGWWRRREW